MLRRTRYGCLAAALALVVATSAACSAQDEPDAATTTSSDEPVEVVRGGTITLDTVAPPGSLDPATSFWGPLAAYYEVTFDTLLRLDAAGEVQPWLATEWTYDDARTELTLDLRDDVTFTDGSKLTAEVVIANLERFKSGTSATATKLASVSKLEAPDDATVVITLSEPDPALVVALAQEAGLVASGDALDDPDLATKPVGSGPYVLDSDATVIGSTYTYEKNPDYWNPDAQYFDTVVIRATTDAVGLANAISQGEVDVALVGGEPLQPAKDAGWTVEVIANGGFAGLMLFDREGVLSEPLGDVRVRQAINYALDRPTLIEATENDGAPTTQIFAATGAAYDEALNDRYPYDPEKAKDLLSEAGYPDGVTITIPDLGQQDSFAFLEEMLAESGISLDFESSQLASSVGDIIAAKYPMVFFALGDANDWVTVQQLLTPEAAFNPFKVELPELDELIEQMRLGDEDEAAEAARAINELIVEEAWFAPMSSSTSVVGHGPDITFVEPTTRTYPSIYDMRRKA